MRKRHYAYDIRQPIPFLEFGGLVNNFLNSPQYQAIDTSNINLNSPTTGTKNKSSLGTVSSVAGAAGSLASIFASGNQQNNPYTQTLPGNSTTQQTVDSLASMIPVVGQIYSAGKAIGDYAKTDYQTLNEYGELTNTDKYITADTIGTFIDPLSSFISGISGEGWTSKQRADKINSAGYKRRAAAESVKAQRFKEGEIKSGYGGKYWDSNNLMQAEYGGELQNNNADRQWLIDWFNHPETKRRMGTDSTRVPEITSRIKSVPITKGLMFGEPGMYYPKENKIRVASYDPELITHELTHAAEYVPSNIDINNSEVYKSGKELKKVDDYYKDPSEQYARLMNVRRALNKKPGDLITEEELRKLKPFGNYRDLGKIFKDYKGLAKVLNEIASTSNANKSMAFGGPLEEDAASKAIKARIALQQQRNAARDKMLGDKGNWNYAYAETPAVDLDKGILDKMLEYKRQSELPSGPAGIKGIPLSGGIPVDATNFTPSKACDPAGAAAKMMRSKEYGGTLPQITEYNTGGQHSENPNGGIPVDATGSKASVSGRTPVATTEEGEISWVNPMTKQAYVFSNKIFV